MTEDRKDKGKHVRHYCRSSVPDLGAGTYTWRTTADDIGLKESARGESDATALLHFVNLVSSDIKSALNKSNRSKRSVDHRKYLQRQISRFVRPSSADSSGHPTGVSKGVVHSPGREKRETGQCVTKLTNDQTIKVGHADDTNLAVTYNYFSKGSGSCVGNIGQESLPAPLATMNGFNPVTSHSFAEQHGFGLKGLTTKHKDKGEPFIVLHPDNCISSTVPLRQRQLPASFWQEPNVPKSHLIPPYYYGLPTNWLDQGYSYKEFLERLQAAHRHGHQSAGSRFPITEFLYYNYGMKNRTESNPHADLLLWPPSLSTHNKKLATVSSMPTACPYIGCNCTNTNQDCFHKTWDCILGQCPARTDIGQSPVWKPIPTKTMTSYPSRYHPFADTH